MSHHQIYNGRFFFETLQRQNMEPSLLAVWRQIPLPLCDQCWTWQGSTKPPAGLPWFDNIQNGGRGPTVHQSPYNAGFHITKSVFFHHFKKNSPIIIVGVGLDVAPRFCGNAFLFGKSTVLVNGVKQRCSHSFCKLSSGFVQMFMLSSHSSIGPKCSKRLTNNAVFIFSYVCFVLCTLPSCARQWIQKWQPSLDGPWWSVDRTALLDGPRRCFVAYSREPRTHWLWTAS